MRNKDYQVMIKSIFDDILIITDKKAHDYASDDDTLKNFKAVGQRLGIPGSEVAWFFITIKLCRLENLKNKDPLCESVEDTVKDLINYVGLYYACKQEENVDCSKKPQEK